LQPFVVRTPIVPISPYRRCGLFATRSLKAFVASVAVVIALFVAAVPAYAKPGNGSGRGSHQGSTNSGLTDLCAQDFGPGATCFVIPLT